MSQSRSKHRRKMGDDKHASHSNVFERLGEDTKDEENWQSRYSKSYRPNPEVMKEHIDHKSDRWPSKSRERRDDQTSSSKHIKSQGKGFHPDYNQDRPRYDSNERRQMQSSKDLTSKKPRQQYKFEQMEEYTDDYDRRRKKKNKTPSSLGSESLSPPPYSSKRDLKKMHQRDPLVDAKEHEFERGRSREKKSKKIKDVTKYKEQPKKTKSSRQYESLKEIESSDFRDSSSEYRQKKRRDFEEYDQLKHPEGSRMEHYKERRDDAQRAVFSSKKGRDSLRREDTDSSVEDKQRYKTESVKASKHQKLHKEEKLYEEPPKPHKKAKSHKVDVYYAEETKPKKKVKSEKDDRSLQYTKQVKEFEAPKKKNKEVFSDLGGSPRSSVSPPPPSKHKAKQSKHPKTDTYSEEEIGEIVEKKMKTKKKKKQKLLEEVEPVKKKKIKHKIEEELPPKKRTSEQFEQEEIKEKPKKVKKRKRAREESFTSLSDSSSQERSRSKKRNRGERTDKSWQTVDETDETTSHGYKKYDEYESSKSRPSVIVSEPRRKRSKLDHFAGEASDSPSSRGGSRMQHHSPPPPPLPPVQRSKRRSSLDREMFDPALQEDKHFRSDKKFHDGGRIHKSDRVYNERRPREQPVHPRDREQDFFPPKSDRRSGQYGHPDQNMGDVRYKDHRVIDKQPFYDESKAPRYHKKHLDPPLYDDKRSYDSRNPSMRGTDKVHYDDLNRRDAYRGEPRKSRNDFPDRDHSRSRQEPHRKQDAYPPRGADYHEFRDSHPPDWQSDRGRRPKDAGSTYSNAPQRVSSWVDSRDGGKLRIETRDSQSYRKNREPPRLNDGDQRDRIDQIGNPRHDFRGERQRDHPPPLRDEVRDHRREKWVPDRQPVKSIDPRHHEKRFVDRRSTSRDRSGHYMDDRASPAFYREVRRSGENRNLDLGIEVTIHDDGGHQIADYDKTKKRRLSPSRKVSSYDTSRDRANNKAPSERSISLHRDRSGSASKRLDRPISPLREAPSNRYPSMHGAHGRDGGRSRPVRGEDKHQSPGSSRDTNGKFTKIDRGRPLERDRSRGSSLNDRDYSREAQSSSRDRSRGSVRDRSHFQHKGERADRKSSRNYKDREPSKSSSDRVKKHSKSRKPESNGTNEKKKSGPEAVDVLAVDWTPLSSDDKKPPPTRVEDGSILQRFTPSNLLVSMGVSSKLLPADVLEKVKEKCQDETGADNARLILSRGLGALNRAESVRQSSWLKTFESPSARLTSYDDANFRKAILGIDEDLRFPHQPPMVINAHSYASSIKHYLNKTKMSVEVG